MRSCRRARYRVELPVVRGCRPDDAGGAAVWALRRRFVAAPKAEKPKDATPHKSSKPTTTTTTTTSSAPKVWWKSYHGTNHVWMPTLGINQHVYLFPCTRSRDPDNIVYRWGCAGSNNVYLLGHAYGVSQFSTMLPQRRF
jgi:hypothetical protein